MDDLAVRRLIYDRVASTGAVPSVVALADEVGGRSHATAALRRLHEGHFIVLGDDGEIAMALPFAARPTGYRVVAGDRVWEANCAWDALAIPAALNIDASIEAAWMDTGEHVELSVRDGQVSSAEGFVHFAVPAARWWNDIVET